MVVARADFVANVQAWRANSAALEIALRDRMGVSLAETNAFLKAQNRITGFVRKHCVVVPKFLTGSGCLVPAGSAVHGRASHRDMLHALSLYYSSRQETRGVVSRRDV
ncbi:hypothetical protein [Sorangium sp. So ce117]|uniref:hypothetical protein n=1 Tax=Sorangium sp. So ce117 TaxID=3133277 RepID=UPI003F5FE87C